MSIKLYVGKQGSGKTASAVKEIMDAAHYMTTYSNIVPRRKVKNWYTLSKEMIISHKQVDTKRKKDGTTEPVFKDELNIGFWQDAVKKHTNGLSVVLDELHNIVGARTSMSKQNIIFNKWMSLIRRMLGSDPQIQGDLIIISQLTRQIDIIAREMAHQVRWHISTYVKTCLQCGFRWQEHSEIPEESRLCPRCSWYRLTKTNFIIYVYCFESVEQFELFRDFGQKTYFKRYRIMDIERYFGFYDTHQIENLFD